MASGQLSRNPPLAVLGRQLRGEVQQRLLLLVRGQQHGASFGLQSRWERRITAACPRCCGHRQLVGGIAWCGDTMGETP
jgi:hypothetical protein